MRLDNRSLRCKALFFIQQPAVCSPEAMPSSITNLSYSCDVKTAWDSMQQKKKNGWYTVKKAPVTDTPTHVVFICHLVMTNIAMENHHAIKNGNPSISMGHRNPMAMLNNQRVIHTWVTCIYNGVLDHPQFLPDGLCHPQLEFGWVDHLEHQPCPSRNPQKSFVPLKQTWQLEGTYRCAFKC